MSEEDLSAVESRVQQAIRDHLRSGLVAYIVYFEETGHVAGDPSAASASQGAGISENRATIESLQK